MSKIKVVVAMSGGVDSSVAAALLVEKGYEVIGMMLRLWSEEGQSASNRCCTPDAMSQAKNVSRILGIPFYVIDVQEKFYQQVVTQFIGDYKSGITPNPCLRCNRLIRWGHLFNLAMDAGANLMATGHYARIEKNKKNNNHFLMRSIDRDKDQSYVLHVLNQEQLSHTIFPLGDYTKIQIRKLALQHSLPVADRSESQDLCFIGNDKYTHFLIRHSPDIVLPGYIKTIDGKILGEHKGLAFYTIGQRRGLGLSSPKPMYVIDKKISENELIVSTERIFGKVEFIVNEVNWIPEPLSEVDFHCLVQIRYRSNEIPGKIHQISGNRVRVTLNHPVVDITPGQAAVFYTGERCLGGGIIESLLED